MLRAHMLRRLFRHLTASRICAVSAGLACGLAACSQRDDSSASTAPAAPAATTTVKPAEDGWVSLFNGKDLTGWQQVGGSVWTVEDGQLVGRQGENYAPGDLLSEKDYRDFELTCSYRVVWPANSGIWFRYQSAAKNYQADILEWPNPVCYSGTLYCQGKMFIAMNTNPDIVDKTGWNTMRVRAEGDHLQLWLNGHQTADVHDTATDHGRIGFQIHPGAQFGPMRMIVREIRIREIGARP